MREIRQSGSEGGGPQPNAASLPLSIDASLRDGCANPAAQLSELCPALCLAGGRRFCPEGLLNLCNDGSSGASPTTFQARLVGLADQRFASVPVAPPYKLLAK